MGSSGSLICIHCLKIYLFGRQSYREMGRDKEGDRETCHPLFTPQMAGSSPAKGSYHQGTGGRLRHRSTRELTHRSQVSPRPLSLCLPRRVETGAHGRRAVSSVLGSQPLNTEHLCQRGNSGGPWMGRWVQGGGAWEESRIKQRGVDSSKFS